MLKYLCLVNYFVVIIILIACGNKSLFDELATNRLKVVLKGSYASNNPRSWTDEYPQDDSVDDFEDSSLSSPSQFLLDIAEIRIADSTGKHKQYFADYRKVFSFNINDDEPFFNGSGIYYKNDDIREGFMWSYIKIYIRKMIFNSAREYYLDNNLDNSEFDGIGEWKDGETIEVIFNEETLVNVFDFNQLQVNTYYDTLLEASSTINRVFPKAIPIENGFIFDYDDEETILEIRMVVKNFVKKYEYDFYNDDNYHYVRHYYAFSDWLRNINADETTIGGNLIAIARTYIKGETVTFIGNAGSSSCYVVAIYNNHSIDEYIIDNYVIGDETFDGKLRPGQDGPGFDEPKSPDQPVPNDFESILDYYLQLEKYKKDYNDFVDCVNCNESCSEDGDDSDCCPDCIEKGQEYENEWNNYNIRINAFKIPPLATWTENGDFELDNVPVGYSYDIYYTNSVSTGELPSTFNYIGSMDVNIDQAGQIITVP